MDSDWMTPREAAEAAGMTWRHVLAAADRSLLPAWKYGRKTVRFRPADVHAWAATNPDPPELPTTLQEMALADLDAGGDPRRNRPPLRPAPQQSPTVARRD